MALPFHRPRAAVPPMDLFGATVSILLPAEASGGTISMFEDSGMPGYGPPLHVHHDADEIFHVLAGQYRFICGGQTLDAGTGDTVLVPRGAAHTFLNTGADRGRLLVTMRPGGFERFFTEVFEAGLDAAEDMGRITAIGERHQIEFLGPNPLAG